MGSFGKAVGTCRIWISWIWYCKASVWFSFCRVNSLLTKLDHMTCWPVPNLGLEPRFKFRLAVEI